MIKVLLVLLSLFICTLLWSVLGFTLEHYGVSNVWFMIAGYLFFPTLQFIDNRIMGYDEKD